MNSRGSAAVVGAVGAVLLALLVCGVRPAGGGYPVYVALAAFAVVVAAALGAVLTLFLLVRRWL